jgi:chitinase
VVVPLPKVAPAVSITAPANSASFAAGANIAIDATASDSDGTVSKVEFFPGDDKTRRGHEQSLQLQLDQRSGGFVHADSGGDRQWWSDDDLQCGQCHGQRSECSAHGEPDQSCQQCHLHGTGDDLEAAASDADGSVAKVEFFEGRNKLGEDTSAPYTFVWNNVAAGSYKLTAKATDNQGATATSSPIDIVVNPASAPAQLVAHYKLDEVSGTVANDASGNTNQSRHSYRRCLDNRQAGKCNQP